jgi:large subunit ribosomal protein L20
MPRVKTGPYTRQRRKGWVKAARGYWGGRHRLYKTARMAVIKSMVTAYKERRRKKRVYRALWIVRLSAALKAYELSYSKFINLLKKAGIELDRRMLSELAIRYPDDFAKIVELARVQAGKLAAKK